MKDISLTHNKLAPSSTKFRWIVVALIFFISVINYIDRSSIAFITHILQQEFNMSVVKIGLIMGAFGVGYIITTFLGGVLTDVLGGKKLYVIIVILWGISCFFMGLASGFLFIFMARILLGVAEGPGYPAITKSLSTWLPINERNAAFSGALVAVPLALAIGAPIVSYLVEIFSWRGMFIVLGVVAIIWIPFWVYLFTNNPESSKFVNKEELALINSKDSVNNKKAIASHNKLFIVTSPTLLVNYFSFFVFGFFLFFFMNWLPSYFYSQYHVNLKQEGIYTMLPWLVAAIFMFFTGKVLDYIYKKTHSLRYSRSYAVILSHLAAAFFIMLLLTIKPSLVITIILLSLAMGCVMSVNAVYFTTIVDVVSTNYHGTAQGVSSGCFAIAGILAPIVAGFIISITGSFNAVFVLLIILAIISALLTWLFSRPDSYKKV